MSQAGPNLTEQLGEAVAAFMSSLPEDEAKAVNDNFARLQASHVGESAIIVGDIAPDFTLPNARGESVTLYTLLNSGPAIVSFYRGSWCPFCNIELRALQARLPDIRASGATLVAVSPEMPNNSMTTIEKHRLEFEVLSDAGNSIARQYGLICSVEEKMRPLYLKWGLDLPACNGDDTWELPVPATYLIDTNSVVKAVHIDKDYTKRMEPDQLIEALRNL